MTFGATMMQEASRKPIGTTLRTIGRPNPRSVTFAQAIAKGETPEAARHPEIANEQSVVDINNFSLYYGDKQALFDISLTVPNGKVTALIGWDPLESTCRHASLSIL